MCDQIVLRIRQFVSPQPIVHLEQAAEMIGGESFVAAEAVTAVKAHAAAYSVILHGPGVDDLGSTALAGWAPECAITGCARWDGAH